MVVVEFISKVLRMSDGETLIYLLRPLLTESPLLLLRLVVVCVYLIQFRDGRSKFTRRLR